MTGRSRFVPKLWGQRVSVRSFVLHHLTSQSPGGGFWGSQSLHHPDSSGVGRRHGEDDEDDHIEGTEGGARESHQSNGAHFDLRNKGIATSPITVSLKGFFYIIAVIGYLLVTYNSSFPTTVSLK